MSNPKDRKINGAYLRTLIIGNGASNNLMLLQNLRESFDYDYYNPPLAMPYEKYLDIIDYVRQILYRDKDYNEGYELMGMGIVRAHFQGAVGQVNRIAANVMGPERGARLFIKNIAIALPFGKHELEEVRPGYARYHLYGVPGPAPLMRGIIRGSLEAGGAKTLKVSSVILSPEEFIHEANWN